jgi:hypothetical protein
MKNKIREFKNYTPEFQKYFHLSLHKFIHPLYGFDIVTFDAAIKTPDGKSTSEFIIDKYGKEAHELVEKLIKI